MAQIGSKLLRAASRLLPDVRFVRAIPNQLLIPLHRKLGWGGGVVKVLGFPMRLNPAECVDAALWYSPHLYDRRERLIFRRRFGGGVFVDVGANIGFWSLYAAHLHPKARILAIEANPVTFALLLENVALNRASGVRSLNIGVGGGESTLPLFLNESGNRGGDSFREIESGRRSVEVQVRPISTVLHEEGITSIDFMKIDIEGLEVEVLSELFGNSPKTLWPRYICAETQHSPQLRSVLVAHGYAEVLRSRENGIYQLTTPDQPLSS